MSYDSNPYYNPAKLGLEIVLEVEEEPDYSFNKFVVWRELATGRFYYATDSGCSCPSPFEDFKSIADLAVAESAQELHDELDDMAMHQPHGYTDGVWGPKGARELNSGWSAAEVADGHRKISELRIPNVIAGKLIGGYELPAAA